MASSKLKLQAFEILSKLGSGSFGTVYKVRRIQDGSLYVMKNVRIVELSYKEQQDAINEVHILSLLSSPYVVTYYDSFIYKDTLHIVMEFCNKGDLSNLIKRAKEKNVTCLREDVIWSISIQIILGLLYLHQKNILHRDLKTANVFLMKDDTKPFYAVKIGDLGVAKLMDTSTALANTIVGTPYYLSPELCADKPYRDKSDCWALGVLVYECCTLQHPFEARNQCALILKIIEAQAKPPPSSNVSRELSGLVMWLLQKDPSDRPSIKEILNEDTVRAKLTAHNYEIPPELMNAQVTSYIRRARERKDRHKNDNTPVANTNNIPRSKQKNSDNNVNRNNNNHNNLDEMTSEIYVSDYRSSSPIITNNNKSHYRLPNAKVDNGNNAPSIRGDRVRGSGNAKRVVSDKVVVRHQINKPISSTVTRSDSKTGDDNYYQQRNENGDFKGSSDNFQNDEENLSNNDQYDEDFEEFNDNEMDPHHSSQIKVIQSNNVENFHALVRGNSSKSTWPSKPIRSVEQQEEVDSKEDGKESILEKSGTMGKFNGLNLVSDQDELGQNDWKPVWTERRGNVSNLKQSIDVDETVALPLPPPSGMEDRESTAAYEENVYYDKQHLHEVPNEMRFSVDDTTIGSEESIEIEIEPLMDLIEEAKARAMGILGTSLFEKVYFICAGHMSDPLVENASEDDQQLDIYRELEQNLSNHSNESACEAVFGVKVLLALESKLQMLLKLKDEREVVNSKNRK
eukprot:gene11936-15977_t